MLKGLKGLKAFKAVEPLESVKPLKPLKPLNFACPLSSLKNKQERRSAFLLYPFNYYICNNN